MFKSLHIGVKFFNLLGYEGGFNLRNACSPIVVLRSTSFTNSDVWIVTFYSPSCLGQGTAKGSFNLPAKLPPAHS